MAADSSILAWEIPCTEKHRGLQSMGLQRIRHDWATEHAHTNVQGKVCSGPLYLWHDPDPCLNLDRLLLWQITLSDVLEWFLRKHRFPGLHLASVGGSCHIEAKYPLSLDQGGVCGAWEKSGSRDVSVVEEARLVYYTGLEVRGEEKVKIIYEGLFHTYRFCVLVFGCLSVSFFLTLSFAQSFLVFFILQLSIEFILNFSFVTL